MGESELNISLAERNIKGIKRNIGITAHNAVWAQGNMQMLPLGQRRALFRYGIMYSFSKRKGVLGNE